MLTKDFYELNNIKVVWKNSRGKLLKRSHKNEK